LTVILALCHSLSCSASVKPYLERLEINLSDRLLTWQIETSVFLTFLRKKTAKERWHSLASHMGDREGYLEMPLPLVGNAFL